MRELGGRPGAAGGAGAVCPAALGQGGQVSPQLPRAAENRWAAGAAAAGVLARGVHLSFSSLQVHSSPPPPRRCRLAAAQRTETLFLSGSHFWGRRREVEPLHFSERVRFAAFPVFPGPVPLLPPPRRPESALRPCPGPRRLLRSAVGRRQR